MLSLRAVYTRDITRQTVGVVVLTLGVITLVEILAQTPLKIFNPNALFLLTVSVISYTASTRLGIVSFFLFFLYLLYYYSAPPNFLQYTKDEIWDIVTFILVAPLIMAMFARFKTQASLFTLEKRARLEAEAKALRNRRLQSVTDTALAHLTLDDLLSELLQRIKDLLQGDVTEILLFDEQTNTLQVQKTVGISEQNRKDEIPFGEGFAYKILKDRRTMAVGRGYHMSVVDSVLKKRTVKSLLGAPLIIEGNVIGVLLLGTFEYRQFSKDDEKLLQLVADRAALGIERARLYKQAQDAIRARDEFLSIASHELRTPLTSVLLQLQSVLHSIRNQSLATFSVEKTMRMLESAEQQSHRLTDLINDLLNVSFISSGHMNLDKEDVNMAALVQSVATRLEKQIEEAGCTMELDLDRKTTGRFDRVRIEQVVTNLFTNAIKYGKGTKIVVRLERTDHTAVLKVRDHGIGIPKDKLDVIFNRFERAVDDKAFQGLGVGLYIVNQIVKAHAGKIWAESEEGKGSTFIVELPLNN